MATGHTQAKRKKVFDKTGGRCAYCGLELVFDSRGWCPEHVIPPRQGGRNLISALAPACVLCNKRKRDQTPDQWRAKIKLDLQRSALRINDLLTAYSHYSPEMVEAVTAAWNAVERAKIRFSFEEVIEEAING